MLKVIFHTIRNCSLREVPISKRDVNANNHCLIQRSLFDERNFFKVLATPLQTI